MANAAQSSSQVWKKRLFLGIRADRSSSQESVVNLLSQANFFSADMSPLLNNRNHGFSKFIELQ